MWLKCPIYHNYLAIIYIYKFAWSFLNIDSTEIYVEAKVWGGKDEFYKKWLTSVFGEVEGRIGRDTIVLVWKERKKGFWG